MTDFDRNKCFRAMVKLSNKVKDNVTGTIYHYTNTEGFEGIIKSKDIWMTSALFVNDTTELRTSLEGDVTFNGVRFESPELFDEFKKKQQIVNPEIIKDYYLASFSKYKNSLDQFRAYGNYCIGFESQELKKNRFALVKCVYKKNDIKKWIIRKNKLADWQNECFSHKNGKLYKGGAFSIVTFGVMAKLKNEHYKSEEEVRLLVVSNSSWRYNNSPEMYCDQPAIYFRKDNMFNVPVPYVKFFIPKEAKTRRELENMVKNKSQLETKQIIRDVEEKQEKELLPINKVIIGPMQNQEEAVFATKMFLLENGYDKVDVIPSDIPFRGK